MSYFKLKQSICYLEANMLLPEVGEVLELLAFKALKPLLLFTVYEY